MSKKSSTFARNFAQQKNMRTLKFRFNLSKPVTLKEMYEMFWKDERYHNFLEYNGFEGTKPTSFKDYEMPCFVSNIGDNDTPLLYRHIIAEQLLKQDNDSQLLDHLFYHSMGMPTKLIRLWMHPLVWAGDEYYQDKVVEGRVAIEKYDSSRFSIVSKMVQKKREIEILQQADDFEVCDMDVPEEGSIKDLHYWELFSTNYDIIYDKALQGTEFTAHEFEALKNYNPVPLRKNLLLIAEKRGGKRAAEILRTFQKEWPLIKVWKVQMKNMTADDIVEFENVLFHGFDNLLAEWEGKNPYDPNTLPPKGKYRELALWLENEKKEGHDHYANANFNRTQMCKNISSIVGWDVNENSLQKVQNKN